MSIPSLLALCRPLPPRLPYRWGMVIFLLVDGLLLDLLQLIPCIFRYVISLARMVAIFGILQVHVAGYPFQKRRRRRLRLYLSGILHFESSLLRVCRLPRYRVGRPQVLAACSMFFISVVFWCRFLVLFLAWRENSSLRFGCVLFFRPTSTLAALVEFVRSFWARGRTIDFTIGARWGGWVEVVSVIILYGFVVLIVQTIEVRITLGVPLVVVWRALVWYLWCSIFIVTRFMTPLLLPDWNPSFLALRRMAWVLTDSASVDGQRVFLIDFSKFDIGLNSRVGQDLIDVVYVRMVVELLWNTFDLRFLMAFCLNHIMQLIFQWIQRNLRPCWKYLLQLEVSFELDVLNLLEWIHCIRWLVPSSARSWSKNSSTVYLAWIRRILLIELFHLFMASWPSSWPTLGLLSFRANQIGVLLSSAAREAFSHNRIKINTQIQPLITFDEIVWQPDVHWILNHIFCTISEHNPSSRVLFISYLYFKLEGVSWRWSKEELKVDVLVDDWLIIVVDLSATTSYSTTATASYSRRFWACRFLKDCLRRSRPAWVQCLWSARSWSYWRPLNFMAI